MENETLIEVEGVYKKFCREINLSMLYSISDILTNLLGKAKPKHSFSLRKGEFFALQNISFEVERGDVIWIFGTNGAGKSTLLKLISKIYQPSQGRIVTKERITSVFDFGSKLKRELSGRENLHLGLTLYNGNRKITEYAINQITQFSELQDVIDMPTKTYSKGMKHRLAFSIALLSDPKILILDDVLAVGDNNFRKKCVDYMNLLRKKKVTMLLVNHQLSRFTHLLRTDDRGIVLNEGKLVFMGPVLKAMQYYQRVGDKYKAQTIHYKSAKVEISRVEFISDNREEPHVCNYGDKLKFNITLKDNQNTNNYLLDLIIFTSNLSAVLNLHTAIDNKVIIPMQDTNIQVVADKLPLAVGKYSVDIVLYEIEEQRSQCVYSIKNAATFIVYNGPCKSAPVHLMAKLIEN